MCVLTIYFCEESRVHCLYTDAIYERGRVLTSESNSIQEPRMAPHCSHWRNLRTVEENILRSILRYSHSYTTNGKSTLLKNENRNDGMPVFKVSSSKMTKIRKEIKVFWGWLTIVLLQRVPHNDSYCCSMQCKTKLGVEHLSSLITIHDNKL